ncbi:MULTISPECIES: hypothetical protein [unclassified Actinomadura]|uniref:hypothetical protein n=1 Tax=unclassified Actinomadura TaxID=2626254 RepID=UPI0011F0884A|nr:hypothetical protein [Actinomadura sp. K4S16]
MTEYPQTAVMAVADMKGSASRNDMGRRWARQEMYAWLEQALGSAWTACVHLDRGDGVLMLWPLSVPDPVPPKVIVSGLLRLSSTAPTGPHPPRLRVAVNIGQAFQDEYGFVGAGVDETFRLNEARVLRAALAQADGPVAYLLSETVHKTVVGYGYEDLDPAAFHPTVVREKESTLRAWLHVPCEDGIAARLAAEGGEPVERPADRAGDAPRPPSGVYLNIGGDARISDSTIAGRDLYL